MTGAAAGVAFVITSCFTPYPPVQRIRELQPLLAKWSIGAPPRHRNVSEEDYCKGLINRLAIRIATITQARQGAAALSFASSHPSQLESGSVASVSMQTSRIPSFGSRPSTATVDGLPTITCRSAVRELRVVRSVASGVRTAFSSPLMDKKVSRSPTAVRWGNDVVSFLHEDPNAVSTDSTGVLGSVSVSDAAAGADVEDRGVRHGRGKLYGSEAAV
ncbi:hypothetical protein NESM_000203100 [Novymonas esmeraldas]|uniref:Uncharacterized protein n=1 Tax=Novymonas esmeraldas TaxID=1808958 RepID=A0AAW0F6F9_9TRYP